MRALIQCAQYLEDMDRVKAFEGKGLQVAREYIYKGKTLSAKEKLQVRKLSRCFFLHTCPWQG